MKFGEAIELMRDGKPVRRKVWSDNTWLTKQINSDINEEIVPNMQSLSDEAKKLVKELGDGSIHYREQVLVIFRDGRMTKATNYIPDWLDIFADDWEGYDAE